MVRLLERALVRGLAAVTLIGCSPSVAVDDATAPVSAPAHPAHDGVPLWQKHYLYGEAGGIGVGPGGDVIVAGALSQPKPSDLGGGPVTAGPQGAAILVRLGPDGAFRWGKVYSPTLIAYGLGAAFDPQGNALMTGAFSGIIDFGDGPLTTSQEFERDVFVAKVDADGKTLWSKSFPSAGLAEPQLQGGRTIAADADGNVIVAGELQGTVSFGGPPLTGGTPTMAAGFVAKFDPNGNHLWSRRAGVSACASLDAAGNVLVAGNFDGGFDLGEGPIGDLSQGAYVVKLNAKGAVLLAKTLPGWLAGWPNRSFAVGPSGDFAIAPWFNGSIDLGTGPLTSTGNASAIAKFDAVGHAIWARVIEGSGGSGWNLGIDGQGNTLAAGSLYSPTDVGQGADSIGPYGAVMAKYDPQGALRWFDASSSEAYYYGVATDAAGGIVGIGAFRGTFDLGLGPMLNLLNGDELFLVRLAP